MSLLSNARLRPSRKKVAPNQRQLIAFRLRQEWFALPIDQVHRITVAGELYGASPEAGLGLTCYGGQPLVVVDVGHQLFSELPQPVEPDMDQLLLILFDQQQCQYVGIPIDSPPTLKKVSIEAIAPLPERYQAAGKIRCVSSSIVQLDHEPLIFVLDPKQLFLS